MRHALVVGTVVLSMSGALLAQQNQPGTDSNRQQPSRPEQSGAMKPADRQFAMDAAHINLAEVELGKLAKEKAASDRVKAYGDRLVTDHGKALDELKSIAQSKSIALPTTIDAKHKATHDKLAALSGAAFDREFAQAMVDGHKQALQKAQTTAKSGADPELKAFASKMTTSVQAHLKMAQELAGGAVGTSGSQNRGADQRPPQ